MKNILNKYTLLKADPDRDLNFIPTAVPGKNSQNALEGAQELRESASEPREVTDSPIEDDEIVTIDLSVPYSGITKYVKILQFINILIINLLELINSTRTLVL